MFTYVGLQVKLCDTIHGDKPMALRWLAHEELNWLFLTQCSAMFGIHQNPLQTVIPSKMVIMLNIAALSQTMWMFHTHK